LPRPSRFRESTVLSAAARCPMTAETPSSL
jgi:hypothetical protein